VIVREINPTNISSVMTLSFKKLLKQSFWLAAGGRATLQIKESHINPKPSNLTRWFWVAIELAIIP
jgi:hypothetical protein